MKYRLMTCWTAAWLAGLWLSCQVAWSQEDAKAEFLAEAPKKWAQLQELERSLSGTFTVTDKYLKSPAKNETFTVDFKISGDNLRYERRGGKVHRAGAMNHEYYFSLERPELADQYSVSHLGLQRDANPRLELVKGIEVLAYVTIPWCLGGRPIAFWLDKPDYFKLKSVRRETRNGRRVVRIDYERRSFPSVQPGGKPLPVRPERDKFGPGWAILDPDRYWTIDESDEQMWGVSTIRKLEYGEPLDGFPRLRKVSSTVRGGGVLESTWEFERLSREKSSDEDFTLSSFGFPEPTSKRRVAQSWMWLAGCGLVVFGAAFALRRYLRRREAARAKPT